MYSCLVSSFLDGYVSVKLSLLLEVSNFPGRNIDKCILWYVLCFLWLSYFHKYSISSNESFECLTSMENSFWALRLRMFWWFFLGGDALVQSTRNIAGFPPLLYPCWCLVCGLYICWDGEPASIVSWGFWDWWIVQDIQVNIFATKFPPIPFLLYILF